MTHVHRAKLSICIQVVLWNNDQSRNRRERSLSRSIVLLMHINRRWRDTRGELKLALRITLAIHAPLFLPTTLRNAVKSVACLRMCFAARMRVLTYFLFDPSEEPSTMMVGRGDYTFQAVTSCELDRLIIDSSSRHLFVSSEFCARNRVNALSRFFPPFV